MTEATQAPTLPALDKLAAALSKAQADLKNPPKTRTVKIQAKTGGSYTYHYADLADVLDCVRETLAQNGLAVTQIVTRRDTGTVLLTRLLHTSGQYVESEYPLPSLAGAQEMGSAITYARRYSLCPLLGIAGETDDDAQQAEEAQETEDAEKKRAATEKLEALRKRGLNVTPVTPAPAEEEKKPEPEKEPDKPAEPVAKVDPKLAEVCQRDSVTPEQVIAWAVAKGNLPKGMTVEHLRSDFIAAVIAPANWKRVVSAIKGGK